MTLETHRSVDTTRTHRISERSLKTLDAPPKGNRIYYDDDIRGFGICVTAAGHRSFILTYRIHGRQRRCTIGHHPDWPVTAARRRAAELKRMVDVGTDPLDEREQARKAPTVRQMWERYERESLPGLSAASQVEVRRYFSKLILPEIGTKRVKDVSYDDCSAIHRKASVRTPTSANRAIAALRRALNLSITWGWIDRNPTKGIKLNQEKKRARFLSLAEIGRLLEALDAHPRKDSADAIKLMMFTGCRRGEALSAKWDQFDPDFRIWTKPASSTKQRRIHRVPVSTAVTTLLTCRRKAVEGDLVFPSIDGEALREVRKTWSGALKAADIDEVRLHDLRHTFASLAVSQGQSLPVIGALLGHSQTQTTARYAHLFDAPLSEASEAVARVMERASTATNGAPDT